jgi:hypothetical protein
MTLPNFVAELKGRGFDGFDDPELIRYINFGYRTVARLTKWSWEETIITKTIPVGSYRLSLKTDLPTVKAVKAVACSTLNYERRLSPIEANDFYTRYAGYDLTSSQNRGEPDQYYLDGAYLYVLPPPLANRDYSITAEQILPELESGVNDELITPEEYDEAILIAAEEHCHYRARQPEFAKVNRQKLQEFFDDAIVDDQTRMADSQPRVIAGRQCF